MKKQTKRQRQTPIAKRSREKISKHLLRTLKTHFERKIFPELTKKHVAASLLSPLNDQQSINS